MNKIQVELSESLIGATLAQDVCREDGVMLLSESQQLTESLIKRLKSYGIQSLYIQESNDKEKENNSE